MNNKNMKQGIDNKPMLLPATIRNKRVEMRNYCSRPFVTVGKDIPVSACNSLERVKKILLLDAMDMPKVGMTEAIPFPVFPRRNRIDLSEN